MNPRHKRREKAEGIHDWQWQKTKKKTYRGTPQQQTVR